MDTTSITIDTCPTVIIKDKESSYRDILANRDYLTEILLHDLEHKLGVIGEGCNKIIYMLCALSKDSDCPFHVITSSRSGTGKSFTQKAVLKLLPQEQVVWLTATTKQSFFYAKSNAYQQKVIYIDEADGMKNSLYSIRIMASERMLRLQTVGTDDSGEKVTLQKEVNANSALMLSTTDAESKIDNETRSRFLVVNGDEGEDLTQKIIDFHIQKNKVFAKPECTDEQVYNDHHNYIDLLRHVEAYFPDSISKDLFILKKNDLLSRRRISSYISVIKTIARTRQYQREVFNDGEKPYILIENDDIQLANSLLKDIYKTELPDLKGTLRLFYESLLTYLNAIREDIPLNEITFAEKEIRQHLQWGTSQTFFHLKTLEKQGFIARTRGKQGSANWYSLK